MEHGLVLGCPVPMVRIGRFWNFSKELSAVKASLDGNPFGVGSVLEIINGKKFSKITPLNDNSRILV